MYKESVRSWHNSISTKMNQKFESKYDIDVGAKGKGGWWPNRPPVFTVTL